MCNEWISYNQMFMHLFQDEHIYSMRSNELMTVPAEC
jgi:hypothetical protein